MSMLYGNDPKAAKREARRALVLSAGSELPFVRWLCLLQARTAGVPIDDAERQRLEREHSFDPARAFWI
jgi:hypothetical protein